MKKIFHIKVFRAVLQKLGQNILCTPENCVFLNLCWDALLYKIGWYIARCCR